MTELEKELIENLEFFIENDDTWDIESNGFWINGLERAKKAVAKAKGLPYVAGDWDNWKEGDFTND